MLDGYSRQWSYTDPLLLGAASEDLGSSIYARHPVMVIYRRGYHHQGFFNLVCLYYGFKRGI